MLSRSLHTAVKQLHYFQRVRCSSSIALKECFKVIEEQDTKINAFVSLNDREELEKKAADSDERRENGRLKSKMDGVTVAVKDNFCTSFLPTTCASDMLKNFTSPYDATVVKLLNDAGALIVGKTNMDEFGMGSLNVHSTFGAVVNPYKSESGDIDEKRSAGGSSGGSAASVAMKMCTAALGSDTGGSVRMPASYCGVVGFKPSYGRCSRHGLVSYANSLDTVGILAREVEDCINVYDIISKYDILDPTSIPDQLRSELDKNDTQLLLKYENDLNGLVVGVPQEFYVDSLSTEVLEVWRNGIKHLQQLGAKIVSVSIPHISLALPAYYIIALAEASSNLSRYDGIRYGHRSPDNVDQLLYVDTRTNGFGNEVKRRILLGTHVLTAGTYEELFLPAQSARRLIQREFDCVFKQANLLYNHQGSEAVESGNKVDILLVPGATSTAPSLSRIDKKGGGGGIEEYVDDVMTLPANLAGIPAITVPFGNPQKENGFPIGLQLLGQYGYDKSLLHIAKLMMK